MATITQSTAGQNRQIIRFASDQVEAVLAELNLSKEEAQLVIEHGDDFASEISFAVFNSLRRLSVSNQFANEEVSSSYGYLSGYKPQVSSLRPTVCAKCSPVSALPIPT